MADYMVCYIGILEITAPLLDAWNDCLALRHHPQPIAMSFTPREPLLLVTAFLPLQHCFPVLHYDSPSLQSLSQLTTIRFFYYTACHELFFAPHYGFLSLYDLLSQANIKTPLLALHLLL